MQVPTGRRLDRRARQHGERTAPSVTTLVLQPSRFEHFVEVHGSVKADRSADLYAIAGGRVQQRILVQEDESRAHQGQMLVDLDNGAMDQHNVVAEAGYALAKDTYEKQSGLWEQKIGTTSTSAPRPRRNRPKPTSPPCAREHRLSQVTAPFHGAVGRHHGEPRRHDQPMPPWPGRRTPAARASRRRAGELHTARAAWRPGEGGSSPRWATRSIPPRRPTRQPLHRSANRTFRISVRVPEAEDAAPQPVERWESTCATR